MSNTDTAGAAVNDDALPNSGERQRTADDTSGAGDRQNGGADGFARRMGWVPEDEWVDGDRRKPSKFLSAEEFVDRAMTKQNITAERLRYFDTVVVKQDRELGEVKGIVSEQAAALKEMLERSRKAEQTGYQRAKRELEAKMDEAAASADTEKYKQTKADLADLEKIKPAEPVPVVRDTPQQRTPPAQPQALPEVERWIGENKWFTTDPVLSAAAAETHGDVTKEMPSASETDRLAETKRRLQEEYPKRFGLNPRRDAPSTVGSPSGGGRQPKKGKTFADLPPEAQAVGDHFIRLKAFKNRDEYAKDYFEQEDK